MTVPVTHNPASHPDLPMGRLEGLEHLCGEQQAIAERAAQWCSSLKPCNVWEDWLVDRIAVESLRVERCTLQEMAMRAHLAGRAKILWEDDRAVDALELARGMAKAPELTRMKLELTSQGCGWLLERWRLLLGVAESGASWDEAQRSLASDLLGRAPELRAVESALPGEPAQQAGLARQDIARLEERRSDLRARVEADARAMAESGVGPEVETQLKALRRYEAQCLRRLEWAFAQFKKGRHDYRPDPSRSWGGDPGRASGLRAEAEVTSSTGANRPRRSNPPWAPPPGSGPGSIGSGVGPGWASGGRRGSWRARPASPSPRP